MKCLQKVKAALLTVIDAGKLYHLEALKAEYPYCVWAEDGAGEQQNGDNYMILQSVQGTIDYYTRDEYDPVVDAIQSASKSGPDIFLPKLRPVRGRDESHPLGVGV